MSGAQRNIRDKVFNHPDYDDTPLDFVHPVMKKYQLNFGDIRRYAHDMGLAPPTLFGIVTGTMLANDVIDARMKSIFNDGDIKELRQTYNPYRHMSFLPTGDTRPLKVAQHYLASMIKPGDAIKTDDNRWLVVSRVENAPQHVHIFSNNFFVTTIHKNVQVTVALDAVEDYRENHGTGRQDDDVYSRKTTNDIFVKGFGSTQQFKDIYKDIAKTLEEK